MDRFDIAKVIRDELKKQNKSVRALAREIGVKHPQIVRVANGSNCTINTLVNILDGLGLEIKVVNK